MAPDKPLMVLQSSSLSQKLNEIEHKSLFSLSHSLKLFHPFPKAIWTFPLSQHLACPGVEQEITI